MKKEDIYKDLLKQYNVLTDKEKNNINIYKSSLFFHINSLSSIDDLNNLDSFNIFNQLNNKDQFINKYELYKEKINDPKNMFIKHSIFKGIDFSNINTFIDSIKDVYFSLENIKNKMVLSDDLIVYRGCSYNDKEYNLSMGNLVSTSINMDIVEDFLDTFKVNRIYQISLKKGTPVLITPYSIVNTYDDSLDMLCGNNSKGLKLTSSDRQGEIVLFKDSLNLELIEEIKVDDDQFISKYYSTVKENKNINNIKK